MKRSAPTYKRGEPVWARMEGFPWWPARVVAREDIELDAGEPEPDVSPDEELVEFFNDEKRFASLKAGSLRPFDSKRGDAINSGYAGMFKDELRVAVAEAEQYSARGWRAVEASTSPRTLASVPKRHRKRKRAAIVYKHGEPVWAHIDGLPWWPARVVARGDIVVDKGESEPVVASGEELVEFFNDNKRFAPVDTRRLRPFSNKRYENINNGYDGKFAADLRAAVAEAKKYSADNGWGAVDSATSHRMEANAPAEPRKKKRRDDMDFKRGDPVWACMEGLPWWPGRIVEREDITLDDGEPEPEVDTDEELVEFFNDEKRFAPVSVQKLRPFGPKRYDSMNGKYKGKYADSVLAAVAEARKYAAEKGLSSKDTDS